MIPGYRIPRMPEKPLFRLDPHVFLGRIANGERLSLVASNPSGVLWREAWRKEADGYHCALIGPCGSNTGPLTYEKAYGHVRRTMEVLCRMDDEEKAIEARWRARGQARP